MEQRNEKTPKQVSRHQAAGPPLAPEQIWTMLNPQQQQGVFRLLVGVCQGLLHHHTHNEQEVTNEPR
jgi:hypothetical protein